MYSNIYIWLVTKTLGWRQIKGCLILPTIRMFAKQFIQICNKEVSKLCNSGHLFWESIATRWFPTQKSVMRNVCLCQDIVMINRFRIYFNALYTQQDYHVSP